jgi:sugar (pentulose or hexulose) kinase
MEKHSKKHEELILAIDAGTQSIRVALIDLKGNIGHMVKTPIEPYFSEYPGWAEQEPEYYWKMLCTTCLELFSETGGLKEAILCVTLTTQRGTVINVDKSGKPLRPAITWLDQRKADAGKILPHIAKPLLKAIHLYDTLEDVVQNCEANWIKQNQPELWENTHKYLLLSGYFTYKLTGEFVDSISNNIGYLPINKKTYKWAHKFDYKWKLFPIEKDKLPDLVKPTEVLGLIAQKALEETGIPKGLPVIAAASDKGCEILGAGCLTPETAYLSFGTTATVNTVNKKYVEIVPLIPPFPAAVPDEYYTEVMIYRGFWMVTWFKEEFGLQERLQAQEEKTEPEVLFDRLIKDVPPGSMGLVLQPYWSPGLKTGPYAKGSIIGFGDVHTRAHLYRAILEGLAFALKEGAQLTEKRNKIAMTQLRVSGGGSQSNTAMQITADIFDMPAQRPHTYETSALGAAIDAAVGLKLFPDFSLAVKEMTRVAKVYEPIEKNRDIYQEIYEKVYIKIYKRLLPLFKDILRILRI